MTKENYYQDTQSISFSMIKDFSRCETLFRDKIVNKIYVEPDHDYLTYGKLVDAFVTESPDFVKENFVLVDKRVKPEDALRYENSVKKLQAEIDLVDDKGNSMRDKVAAGNKTAIKGLEKRTREIQEFQDKLSALQNLAGKEQVTRSLWEEAEQTALALKTHPYFTSMVFDQFTSQQIFIIKKEGVSRKGRLDHLKLCPQIEKLYKLYVAKQLSYEDMGNKIAQMDPRELWATITDIKTCYSMEKLEPFNDPWLGQLSYYQDLVSEFLLIPTANIKCQIFGADKVSNNFKMAELFTYPQTAINEQKADLDEWVRKIAQALKSNVYISSKAKNGFNQKCYTCQECRLAPFSTQPGQPVLVTGPRFKKQNLDIVTQQESNIYIDPLLI